MRMALRSIARLVALLAVVAVTRGALAQPPQTSPAVAGRSAVGGQASAGQEQVSFSRQELAQMLAPIALYPDPLLGQVLMASTYPLEVVEANRWVAGHAGLTNDALDQALAGMDWDPSVKALCHYPDVLAEMERELARTTQLGNAFLAQQSDVMEVIQDLRHRAEKAGTLNTNAQLQVIAQGSYVSVIPADPAVMAVPIYDPSWAFGSWWYPDYQPYAWFPGYVQPGVLVFSRGFAINQAVTDWVLMDWAARNVRINNARVAAFAGRPAPAMTGTSPWTHNPAHRRGVAYASPLVGRRFGQNAALPQRAPRIGGAVGAMPGARLAAPGAAPLLPGARGLGPMRAGQASRPTPFTGLGRQGSGFESRSARRGATLPGQAVIRGGNPAAGRAGIPVFGRGGAPAGRPGGGGGFHGGAPAPVPHASPPSIPHGGGGFHGGGGHHP